MIDTKEIHLLENKLLGAYYSQVDHLLNTLEGKAKVCVYNDLMRRYNAYFFERSNNKLTTIKVVTLEVDSVVTLDRIDPSKGIFLNRPLFYSGLEKNISQWKEIYDALTHNVQGDKHE